MNEPVTVTYSLQEILKEIKQEIKEVKQEIKDVNTKLDTLEKEVVNIKVGQATLTEKVGGMDKRLEKVESVQNILVNEVADLKGVKSLIIPIVVAIVTAFLTLLVRFIPNFTSDF